MTDANLDDLVRRLRAEADATDSMPDAPEVCRSAADAIDALRAELADWRESARIAAGETCSIRAELEVGLHAQDKADRRRSPCRSRSSTPS